MNDPHLHGLVSRSHYTQKTDVLSRLVAILDWGADNRGLALIPHLSRGVRRGDILELVTTDEADVRPGSAVNAVAYLGFVEVTEGGLALCGDRVFVDKEDFGEIVGFDETHAPNHLNVVIRVESRKTGHQAGLTLNSLIKFEGIEEKTDKKIGF